MANQFTFKQQIECVEREIAMRERVYPNWVAQGKLRQEKANYQIGCMRAVLRSLESLNRQYEEMKNGGRN